MQHDYLTFEDSIDVHLERLDGTAYSFKEAGIGVRNFLVRSPHYVTEYENLAGANGVFDTGTTLGYRQIKMSLYFVAESMEDYADKRDEIFSMLDSRESFYVTESRRPYQRWLVKIEGSFEPDQIRIFGFFDVDLISASPFAMSPGTTLNLPKMEHYYPIGEWRITENDPVVEYAFSSSSFSVFNDGVALDPRSIHTEMRIILKGSLNNPAIRNLTTSDEWNWTGTATASDEIVLDGIRSLKNGHSIFAATNKQLIRLAPGWNEFQVTGVSDFTIQFDFRFLYIGKEPRKWTY